MTDFHDISFIAKHPKLDLSCVAEKIGIVPFRIWKVGEPRQTPKGTKLKGNHEESYCCIRFESVEDITVSDQLTSFLSKIYDHREFFENLVFSGGSYCFYIFLNCKKDFREIFSLSLIKKLYELNIYLMFETDKAR